MAMHGEVEGSTQDVGNLARKIDTTEDAILLNRARLNRIR